MEHYDWNEGWLFTPTFDPALVRPECPELSLTPVRLPHTVKPLPYNYCNENDYQRLCGYRREFFAEGQLFYTYKRNQVKDILWLETQEMTEDDYILWNCVNTEFNP